MIEVVHRLPAGGNHVRRKFSAAFQAALDTESNLLLQTVERHQSTACVTRLCHEVGWPIFGTDVVTILERVLVHPADGEDRRPLVQAVHMLKIDGQRRLLRTDDLEGAGLDLDPSVTIDPQGNPLIIYDGHE